MRCAAGPGDAPAGFGGGRGLRAGLGQDEAGDTGCRRRQRQSPRRCQSDATQGADDEGRRARAQAFFDCPEPVRLARGLDNENGSAIEPEGCKAGGVQAAVLGRECGPGAPEHERDRVCPLRQGCKPPGGELEREGKGRRPIQGGCGLDLVQGRRGQPVRWQLAVEAGISELPCEGSCRPAGDGRLGRYGCEGNSRALPFHLLRGRYRVRARGNEPRHFARTLLERADA